MTYTTNILALPLVLTIWSLDMYLLLLMVYGVLTKLSSERASQLCICLRPFTEPLPRAVKRWLGHRTARSSKQWLPWAIVVFGGLILRHLLVLIVVSLG